MICSLRRVYCMRQYGFYNQFGRLVNSPGAIRWAIHFLQYRSFVAYQMFVYIWNGGKRKKRKFSAKQVYDVRRRPILLFPCINVNYEIKFNM